MQNEEIFIPLEAFRIKQRYCPQFGIFYAVRVLLSIQAEGGRAWQKILFYCCFTLPGFALAIAIDALLLSLYVAYLVCKKLLDIATAATISLFDTIIKKVIGVTLFIITICLTLFILYLKWHDITEYIKNLFL